jgi:hypothetical protein
VLPKPDFCGTHPLDPTCLVFNPGAGGDGAQAKDLAQAVQTTVTLINTSTAGGTAGAGNGGTAGDGGNGGNGGSEAKVGERQAGPAASEKSGAKNDKPATKTYCN